MTQEQKAKAYDEAIEKFDVILNLNTVKESGTIFADDVRKIFPELAESEDEKIRKWIIDELKDSLNSIRSLYSGDYDNRDKDDVLRESCLTKALAWLEKQGENNMGISEATKQKLEDNLNKALEKETPESWNEFLERQDEPKEHDVCDNCEQQGSCVSPCCVKLVEKNGGQNPAWSEEDEERLSDAIFFVREYQIPTRDKRLLYAAKETEDWLRTFKEKVQSKREWSEEDERYTNIVVSALSSPYLERLYHFNDVKSNDIINWFESLKDRYTWKPSDEQMKILNEVLNFAANHESPHWNDCIFGTLHNLIRQLKKLREEDV